METSRKTEEEKTLLKKYLADECSPEEKERLEAWYSSFDHSPLPGRVQERFSLNKVKRTVLHQVHAEQPGVFRLPRYFRIAALFILLLSISFIIYRAADSSARSSKEYSALNGQQKVLKLSDGSIVTLNSGSVLKIQSDFKQNTREVSLSGEAFFQVAKDPSRPFIVSTGVLRTRVLGTAFNVQAYQNEEELTVTVAEGKVRVDQDAATGKQPNLSPGVTPGKQLVYNRTTQSTKVIPADADHISAWRTGTVYIDNESIPAIARKLERRFNISIGLTGKVKSDCRYTLRIGDETLGKTLQVLTSVAGITCKFNQQDRLTINTTACK
ncbi:FecR family protein [Pedobacter hartonius]|uniref:FecR family protein n=1 Tax=Pedobacter hartonius TaxID=425514 RepID=A0A1H4GA94_9SPHI|nr:FecR family protein [Pedobacter hartonius]SEB06545.1 FecR family protein [Pedobacter hartonius]